MTSSVDHDAMHSATPSAVLGDVSDRTEGNTAVFASSAENDVGNVSDHVESINALITSASNVAEELASKTIVAGDSLAASIDSADTAAPVTESIAQSVAVITSFIFLHF